MKRLFAEQFFSPAEPADVVMSHPSYDERRALNLDGEGRVFVERQSAAVRTATVTEADAEAEDRDAVAYLGTESKAVGDPTDFVASELLLGTDTRQAPESEDRAAQAASASMEALLGTETLIHGEAADRLEPSGWAGTGTAVGGEPDDRLPDISDW